VRRAIGERLPARSDDLPETAARNRIFDLRVDSHGGSKEERKKLTATDGRRVLRTLVRCRLTEG